MKLGYANYLICVQTFRTLLLLSNSEAIRLPLHHA